MEIYRNTIDDLLKWKVRKDRKPVLLKGARQIGKTWVMRTFGKSHFKNMLEINFDMQPEMVDLFERTKDPRKIVAELQLYANGVIEEGQTLLVFDEIQACESALNSLKYFAEMMPDLHIIAAGSLLGVAVRHKRMTVPVGKVEVLQMYPVSFDEFFHSSEPKLWDWLNSQSEVCTLPVVMRQKLSERYRQFLICGGMPKAVVALLEQRFEDVDREINGIISMYEADFSKYATPAEVIRIGQIWRSLPSQLAKENRKFVYKVVKSGARAREYEDALLWLQDAGLVTIVHAVEKPSLPLNAYKDLSAFKVYSVDCGVLRCLCHLPANALLSSHGLEEMKGAMAENFVLQSILPHLECEPHYWASEGKAEVDFVTQIGTTVIPIEVKAGSNLSGKSLKSYADKYQPSLMLRIADTDLSLKDHLLSIPLPLAFKFKEYVRMVE